MKFNYSLQGRGHWKTRKELDSVKGFLAGMEQDTEPNTKILLVLKSVSAIPRQKLNIAGCSWASQNSSWTSVRKRIKIKPAIESVEHDSTFKGQSTLAKYIWFVLLPPICF